MSDTLLHPDPSAHRWLAATLGVVVLSLGALGYQFYELSLPPAHEPPKPQITTIVRHAVVDPPEPPPVDWNFPPLPLTPAEQEKARQEMVHKQAEYLREWAAKDPHTESLATPEQIAEMEKEGRLAW